MKLVELAEGAVQILKDADKAGIRSDVLAQKLKTPKRRVYDVLAVLRALKLIRTKRRFDGTTVWWMDPLQDYTPSEEYEALKEQYDSESEQRKKLQVEVAEVKEQLRITRSKLRRDTQSVESAQKTEFATTQLRIRPLSMNGKLTVKDAGYEVTVECTEPGLVVDPTEKESDKTASILRSLQKT